MHAAAVQMQIQMRLKAYWLAGRGGRFQVLLRFGTPDSGVCTVTKRMPSSVLRAGNTKPRDAVDLPPLKTTTGLRLSTRLLYKYPRWQVGNIDCLETMMKKLWILFYRSLLLGELGASKSVVL